MSGTIAVNDDNLNINAFYLIIDKANPPPIPLECSVDFKIWTDSVKSQAQGLYIIRNEKSQFYQSGLYSLFNLGTLIYKDKWRIKALELIVQDMNHGQRIEEIVALTRGQFCLIIHSFEKVLVITDRLGVFPIYKFEDFDKIVISNLLLPLARNNAVSINRQSLAEFISFYYCFNATLFNEITCLKAATIYQFHKTRNTIQYDAVFKGIEFDKYNDLRDIALSAVEILSKNLSFLAAKDRAFADLTGGVDTRLNAVLLKSLKVDFDTGICGEQDPGELNLAQEVAEKLSIIFRKDIIIPDRETFDSILEYHFSINTGVPTLYHSSELINYYKNISQFADIHITGFGGELSVQSFPKCTFFRKRVDIEFLLHKYAYNYLDIYHKDFINSEFFYQTLRNKIINLLNEFGTDLHKKTSRYLRMSTLTRWYHGLLIGTHNTIFPTYSPLLEANYVRYMLAISFDIMKFDRVNRAMINLCNLDVASIMTSHGYSECLPGSTSDILYFGRESMKSLARRLLYSLRLFRLKQWIERHNILSIHTGAIAERQRPFWVDFVNEHWSDNLEIFKVINKEKLHRVLSYHTEANHLKAIILYLNRMITESNCKL